MTTNSNAYKRFIRKLLASLEYASNENAVDEGEIVIDEMGPASKKTQGIGGVFSELGAPPNIYHF